MSEEHGVILLEQDLQEICNIANEMQEEDVTRQRELLKAFTEWHYETHDYWEPICESNIDDYINKIANKETL